MVKLIAIIMTFTANGYTTEINYNSHTFNTIQECNQYAVYSQTLVTDKHGAFLMCFKGV